MIYQSSIQAQQYARWSKQWNKAMQDSYRQLVKMSAYTWFRRHHKGTDEFDDFKAMYRMGNEL